MGLLEAMAWAMNDDGGTGLTMDNMLLLLWHQ